MEMHENFSRKNMNVVGLLASLYLFVTFTTINIWKDILSRIFHDIIDSLTLFYS